MRRGVFIFSIGIGLVAAGCTRRVAIAPLPTVWDRQIQNARDAGDGDYTLRVLRECIAAEPENVAARVELAQAYRDRGYPDVALEMARLAAARFPDSGPAQLLLAQSLRDQNRRAEAIQSLSAFLAAHPQTSPEFAAWLGILHDESGRPLEAEAAHRHALALAPSADHLHNNLGYNLLTQKKYEAAAAELREALRLNPASQVARNNLGLALANQNATTQALAAWEAVDGRASAHNNLAAVWIEKGNYPDARKELAIALGYNRSHPAALSNLELVARLDGMPATVASIGRSRWARWKAGVRRLFAGPLDSGTGEKK
jgi:tetratricopeptide (TPR) repeat protein